MGSFVELDVKRSGALCDGISAYPRWGHCLPLCKDTLGRPPRRSVEGKQRQPPCCSVSSSRHSNLKFFELNASSLDCPFARFSIDLFFPYMSTLALSSQFFFLQCLFLQLSALFSTLRTFLHSTQCGMLVDTAFSSQRKQISIFDALFSCTTKTQVKETNQSNLPLN